MRRLIKKSYNTLIQFMEDWFYNWISVPDSDISQVINEHKDCIYNGMCYRFIGLDLGQVFYKDLDIENKGQYISKNYIIDGIKPYIEVRDKYVSWAKDFETCEQFQRNTFNEDESYSMGVIIRSTMNGLDLHRLYKNNQSELNNLNSDIISSLEIEQEVLAKVSTNYQIIALIINNQTIKLNKGSYFVKDINNLFDSI